MQGVGWFLQRQRLEGLGHREFIPPTKPQLSEGRAILKVIWRLLLECIPRDKSLGLGKSRDVASNSVQYWEKRKKAECQWSSCKAEAWPCGVCLTPCCSRGTRWALDTAEAAGPGGEAVIPTKGSLFFRDTLGDSLK